MTLSPSVNFTATSSVSQFARVQIGRLQWRFDRLRHHAWVLVAASVSLVFMSTGTALGQTPAAPDPAAAVPTSTTAAASAAGAPTTTVVGTVGPPASSTTTTLGAPPIPALTPNPQSNAVTAASTSTTVPVPGAPGAATTPSTATPAAGTEATPSTLPGATLTDSAGATATSTPDASLSLNVGDPEKKPSQSVLIIVLLTLLSVAPALLILMTSFTRIAVVLSLTRNALGLQAIPPNQVIVGLALFLSLFVMRPTLQQMNDQALQPMLRGEMTQAKAFEAAMKPMQTFMLKQTRSGELALFTKASGLPRPKTSKDVSMLTLIPAFILSELKTAFIIGFIIFIPFLVIDLIVSSSLMSMGMMMLPPVLVSLPFKLLLFVMVDGWALIINSLLKSFH